MVLPDAVHDHAGRERVLAAHDPARQLQSSAALTLWWEGLSAEHDRESPRNLRAEPFRVALDLDARVADFALTRDWPVGDRVRRWVWKRLLFKVLLRLPRRLD